MEDITLPRIMTGRISGQQDCSMSCFYKRIGFWDPTTCMAKLEVRRAGSAKPGSEIESFEFTGASGLGTRAHGFNGLSCDFASNEGGLSPQVSSFCSLHKTVFRHGQARVGPI